MEQVMRSLSVSRDRMTSQPVIGIGHRAEDGAHAAHGRDDVLGAQARAGDEVAVAADVLGQRVQHQVGAVRERLLPERPEERVVDATSGRCARRGMLARELRAGAAMSTSALVGFAGVSV
jgi:hypothetical protein